MRASELRGVAWNSVDLENDAIRVERRADRWSQLGPPKSKAGNRTIPLPAMVRNTLREWKLRCPQGRLNLVFPTGRGTVQSLSNISKRGFGPLQVQCGVVRSDGKPRYGFHSLRHAAASLFIEQGMMPKQLQVVMGHSSIALTFDTYGHLLDGTGDLHAVMEKIEADLTG